MRMHTPTGCEGADHPRIASSRGKRNVRCGEGGEMGRAIPACRNQLNWRARNAFFGMALRKRVSRACGVLAALALTMTLSSFADAGGPASVDLKTIQAGLDFYESSVTTLVGQYNIRVIPRKGIDRPPGTLVMEDLLLTRRFRVHFNTGWTYMDERKSWLYSGISPTERFLVDTISTYDGSQSYHLLHTLAHSPFPSSVPPDTPHRLNMFSRDDMQIYYAPWHFSGRRLRHFNISLASLFRSGRPELKRSEMVDGVECCRVSIDVEGVLYTVWLDPTRDYLPLRQEFLLDEAAGNRKPMLVLRTLELKQCDDSIHRTRRWCPVRGQIDGRDLVRTMDVLDQKLNVPLKRAAFRIEPSSLPPGIQVNWETKPATVTGGQTERYRELAKLIDEETKAMSKALGITNTRKSSGPVRVTYSRGSWMYWLFIAGSAVLLIAGVLLVVRERARHRT